MKTLVSFVIPCYRSEATLPGVVREIQDTMETLEDYRYEIVLVNDCSPDDTFSVIRKLCRENDNIIGVDLAKNFGQHGALMAGFHQVRGEIVVCLDDDGQTPADEAGKLLEAVRQGADVVYARYGHKHHSGFRNWGSHINELMTRMMLGKPKELYLSSYFAAKRFVVDEMTRYQYAYPYVIGLVLRTTKNIVNVDVEHRDRQAGVSGYTIGKLLNLWFNGFTAFSVKPLRIATVTGAVCAFMGFAYGIYTIIKKIFINPPGLVTGFSALMSVLVFMGGMLMLMLGLVGEYMGRMYISMNNSPQFVIRQRVGRPLEEEESGNTAGGDSLKTQKDTEDTVYETGSRA
ncbi:MAG: glycosyltransferase family 2 protein [Clostridium sp.]|nr:glycosyltransferase family 2 protein [Clostridium sp.]